MGKGNGEEHGWSAAAAVVALAGFLAGCAPAAGPAPVVSPGQPMAITIERGQTLSGIAEAYHVPMRELAAANHLAPPYRILAGGRLLIPVYGASLARAMPAAAPPAASARAAAAPPVAVASLPPQPAAPAAAAPVTLASPRPAAPIAPAPVTLMPPRPAAPTAPAPVTLTPPQPSETVRSAELTPPERAAPPPSPAETRPVEAQPANLNPANLNPGSRRAAPVAPPAAHPTEAALSTGGERAAPPAHNGAAFPWPVRGHVIEGFGAGPDGTRNDGINIAAPRGSPVQAVDGGVVAYAGNELRGYGNLILIKSPGGWISAYAHCDMILVRRGQKVARGQVIARVGSTGNVSTPQLHFELRRGDKPVDPRAYLGSLPSAGAAATRS
jgi:murein DD-endopeptidase MepM/ murein hydrolase activator NlpD